MIKTVTIPSLFLVLFIGSVSIAQARSRVSFGVSINIGPTVPCVNCCYPAYPRHYYSGYYVYPPVYPYYQAYVAPRYYQGYRSYEPRRHYRGEWREVRRERREQRNDRWRSNPRRY